MVDQNLRRNYDVYLGDDGVIYNEVEVMERTEEKSTEMAQLEHQSVQKILKEKPKSTFPLLIDFTRIPKKHKYTSEGARIAYVALMAESQIVRVAFLGDNQHMKRMTEFLTEASGMKGKARWFRDKQKAQNWLFKVVKK